MCRRGPGRRRTRRPGHHWACRACAGWARSLLGPRHRFLHSNVVTTHWISPPTTHRPSRPPPLGSSRPPPGRGCRGPRPPPAAGPSSAACRDTSASPSGHLPPASVHSSASKSSIRRLKAATTAFTFKTLLRHYAKRVLTPR